MNAQQYQTALTTLSLTSRDVCAWLGVSRRGEALWRESGPSNLAGRLIEMQLALRGLERLDLEHDPREAWADMVRDPEGLYIRYDDIAPLLAVAPPQDDAS